MLDRPSPHRLNANHSSIALPRVQVLLVNCQESRSENPKDCSDSQEECPIVGIVRQLLKK